MPFRPDTPGWTLRRLVALNDAPALRAFLAATPGWQALEVDGFAAWSRILVCRRRAGLLSLLAEHGFDPNRPLTFRGVPRVPLDVALKHGRPQVLDALLKQATPATFASFGGSALAQLLARQTKHGEWTAETLMDWLARFRAAGAPLCPAALAWCLDRAANPASQARAWVREGLAQGIEPAFTPQTRAGWQMGVAHAFLDLALRSRDAEPLGWLQDRLAVLQHTALWADLAFGRRTEHPSRERLGEVMACVDAAWADRTWNRGDWPDIVRSLWESGMASAVAPSADRLANHLVLIRWGLAHGMPARFLMDGTRALAKPFLASGAANRTFDMLELLAEQGFGWQSRLGDRWSTGVRVQEGKSLEAVMEGNLTFWNYSPHRAGAREIVAQAAARRLEAVLPAAPPLAARLPRL